MLDHGASPESSRSSGCLPRPPTHLRDLRRSRRVLPEADLQRAATPDRRPRLVSTRGWFSSPPDDSFGPPGRHEGTPVEALRAAAGWHRLPGSGSLGHARRGRGASRRRSRRCCWPSSCAVVYMADAVGTQPTSSSEWRRAAASCATLTAGDRPLRFFCMGRGEVAARWVSLATLLDCPWCWRCLGLRAWARPASSGPLATVIQTCSIAAYFAVALLLVANRLCRSAWRRGADRVGATAYAPTRSISSPLRSSRDGDDRAGGATAKSVERPATATERSRPGGGEVGEGPG